MQWSGVAAGRGRRPTGAACACLRRALPLLFELHDLVDVVGAHVDELNECSTSTDGVRTVLVRCELDEPVAVRLANLA